MAAPHNLAMFAGSIDERCPHDDANFLCQHLLCNRTNIRGSSQWEDRLSRHGLEMVLPGRSSMRAGPGVWAASS